MPAETSNAQVPLSDGALYTIPIRRIQAFSGLALNRGWDINSMLDGAGINVDVLVERRSRVTTAQLTRLIQQLSRTTDDEMLGFGPAPMPRGSFRLLCFALLSSGNVGEGIDRLQRFGGAMPAIPGVDLVSQNGLTKLSIDVGSDEAPVDLLVDCLLAAAHRFIGWAIGCRVPLDHIEVPYSDSGELDDYDLIFGTRVVFDSPAAALVFPSEILRAPIVRSEKELEDFLRSAPGDFLARRDFGTTLADRIRRMLQRGIPGDIPAMEDIPPRLAMSSQTVRRRLREEGTSLRKIRDDLLRDTAIVSLARGEETIAQLSERLGFSEPSAFTRAFRRWTGSSPSAYRVATGQSTTRTPAPA